MKSDAKKIAELLRILANEHRLIILCILLENSQTVSEIAQKISKVSSISQPAISQHLSLLKAHGILDSQKSGLSVTYSIADNRVKEVIDVLKVYYCARENKV